MKDLIESVEAVTALGLMQGDENGSFKPKDNITKEQVIVTLLKLDDINQKWKKKEEYKMKLFNVGESLRPFIEKILSRRNIIRKC